MGKTSRLDPVEVMVEGAASDSDYNEEAAVEAVTTARPETDMQEPTTIDAEPVQEEIPHTGEVFSPEPEPVVLPKRMTKAQALEEVARLQLKLKDYESRLKVLEARTDGDAINNLGATFALAIQVAGQFTAAKRGKHWLFPPDEAKTLGEAYAIVAAPYAEQLKQAVPWAMAIGLTWQSLSTRLEQDKLLMPQSEMQVATSQSE